MEFQEFLHKYPTVKKNILPIGLGLLGLMFFVYGLIVLFGEARSEDKEIVFESGEQPLETDSQIKVDVAAGVINPGVYSLNPDARIQDGLVAAGGLSENADREWVSKNLNLAQRLADGTKIYIPKIGENVKGIAGSIASDQININTGSIEALDSLPGVGSVTAQKIIDGRPYSSIDELLSSKIVGSKVFEEIKEKITVY